MYKVGEYVVFVGVSVDAYDPREGSVGVVTEVHPQDTPRKYRVWFNCSENKKGRWYCNSELQKIELLKTGDSVAFVGPKEYEWEADVGQIGVIERVDANDPEMPYVISFPSHLNGERNWYFVYKVKLLKAGSKEVKVGDRLRFVGPITSSYEPDVVGEVGVVCEIDESTPDTNFRYRLLFPKANDGKPTWIRNEKLEHVESVVAGDLVVATDAIKTNHQEYEDWYPVPGTVGRVVNESGGGGVFVQWEKGSTSKDDMWCCEIEHIRKVILD